VDNGPQFGVTLGDNVRLNHIAFTDDVSLITQTNVAAVVHY